MASSSRSPRGIPCSFKNLIRYSRGIRRSCEPGMRYPLSRPESNHLLTVRGATLQILATCPVVKTFIARSPLSFTLLVLVATHRRACGDLCGPLLAAVGRSLASKTVEAFDEPQTTGLG